MFVVHVRISLFLLFFLFALIIPLQAQIDPIPNLTIQPVPIPGGDIIPPYGLFNQFFPGPPNQTPPFDPANSDPNGISNFRGVTAMGYTFGTANPVASPYDVSPDGQRFLVNGFGERGMVPLTLVVNWKEFLNNK